MQSNKANALWISNKYEQGVGETDWKQYAALMTTPQTTSNSSLVSATTSALTLSSSSLPVMLEESGGTKTLFSDSSKLTSENSPDVTTGTVSTSNSRTNTYSYGFLVTPDGTQVGFLNYNAAQLQVYTMSTPYDLSTASNTNNYTMTEGNPVGDMRFNADGTKIFALYSSNAYYYYSFPLSTAYDLTTFTNSPTLVNLNSRNPDNAFAVTDTDTAYFTDLSYSTYGLFKEGDTTAINLPDGTSSQIQSLYFEDSGAVLYALRYNGILYQYSLSTPYDISTASYNNLSLNIGGTISNSRSIQTAGGYLYIQVQPTNSTLYRISGDFSRSFEYNISSLSLSSAPTNAYQLPSCSVALGSNEIATNAYPTPHAAVSSSTTSVTMGYNTSTDPVIASNDPIDVAYIKTVGLSNPGTQTNSNNNIFNGAIRTISEDGTKVFDWNSGYIYRYPLSTAFDITTVGSSNQSYYAGSYNRVQFITYDGRHLLIYYVADQTYYIYSLATPYDVTSTKTFISSNDIGAQFNTTVSNNQIFMTNDLKHVYVGQTASNVNTIYHYIENSFSDSLQTNMFGTSQHIGLVISADGNTLYGTQSGSAGAIYEYELASPFALANATLTSSISASSGSYGNLYGIALDPSTFKRLYINYNGTGGTEAQYTSTGRFGGNSVSTTASSVSLSGTNTVITFPTQSDAPDGLVMPDTSTAANFTGFTTSGSNWIIESDKVTLAGSNTGRYIQYKIGAPNSGMTTSNLQLNLWKLP